MLHTKFQGHQSVDHGVKDFKGFQYIYRLGGHIDHVA